MPYAVKVGRETGIFESWKDCQAQVNGFPDAQFKKFTSEQDATAYLDGVITIPTSGLCVSTFRNDHAIGYQGVWLPNNEKAFLCKLTEGERHNDHLLQFLAIAHAVVVANANSGIIVYSKSGTAISWASKAQVKSSFDPQTPIMKRVERAIEQLKKIQSTGQVSIELWDSSNWGEIPKLM